MNTRNLLAGLLLAVPFAAWAGEGGLPTKTSGLYLGAGGGYSKIDAHGDAIDVSGEDLSLRVLAGYRFAQIRLPFDLDLDFGIEAAYVDLGEADEPIGGADVIIDMSAVTAAGVVYWPISRTLDVFGKAGVYIWDGQVKVQGNELADENSTDLAFGVGIAWQTGTAFGAQLEIESLDALDGVWVATLSATYQFK